MKVSSFSNLKSQQPHIDKFYLYVEDPDEAKCQLLINKPEVTRLKLLSDSKSFIGYSNEMDEFIKIVKNKKT